MTNKAANNGQQSIEELQERYKKLHTKKIQAETNLENAQNQLGRLQNEAREKYGTDNLDELRKKLDALKAENETRRADYQLSLERIETELAAVERSFDAAKSPEKSAP